MADKRVCEGYEVIKSHRVGKVEVVLAYNPNPKVPQQYVTWKAYAHTKFKDFAYGRYFNDRASAEKSFHSRVDEVREDAGLPPLKKKQPHKDDMER